MTDNTSLKVHIETDYEDGSVMCGIRHLPIERMTNGSGDEGDPELTEANVDVGILCKTCWKAYLAEGRS